MFLRCLREYFLMRKSSCRNTLILEYHISDYNIFDILQLAKRNNVTVLCLLSHETPALKRIDRLIFGPLKPCCNKEAKTCMRHHKDSTITRYKDILFQRRRIKLCLGNGVSWLNA